MTALWLTIVAIVLTAAAAAAVLRRVVRESLARARERADRIVQEAENRAEIRLKEADLEAQERRAAAEAHSESEARKRRQQIQEQEERAREQERNLGRRQQLLAQKQQEIDEREARVKERETAAADRERDAAALTQEARQRLERLAGTTAAQARREILREVETEARQEAVQLVRRIEEEAREQAEERARRLVAEALQRLPEGTLVDNVTTVIRLPNDDMKGRIIGREGRNIRAIEMATGVDLIVDSTPQIITLSSFDSYRRAVAAAAIERLIEDGRIHPARIEETVERARADMESSLESTGEAAAFDLGLTGLHPRLTRLLGKLRYRVVLGYNLLAHSLEVARLASALATDLGVSSETVRRAGLLHEIGRAEEGDGAAQNALLVSADLASRCGESPRVAQAIRALHEDDAEPSLDAALLRVAERAVVNRPGERDDKTEAFIERLQRLEEVAASFKGVSRAFAIRSGKELRVLVEAGQVSDDDVVWLSRDITARIRKEVQFPGSVKVSVIRETRAVDYAT